MPAQDRLLSLRTVVQAILILAISAGFGLAWNASRGASKAKETKQKHIELSKQYFSASALLARKRAEGRDPKRGADPVEPTPAAQNGDADPAPTDPATTEPATTEPATTEPATTEPATTDPTPTEPTPPANEEHTDRIVELGLQPMTVDEAELYHADGAALFVDARNREDYEEGHIPGAVYLNHYQSADLIEEVRPDLEAAFMVVVYCNGGDCDDSINLALDLVTLYGIPNGNVYVFDGGMEVWKARGLPVVTGGERE